MAKEEMRRSQMSAGPTQISQSSVFHYALIVLVLATLVVSTLSLVNTYRLKTSLIPQTIDVNNFLKKLTSHEEMKGYVGIAPLNIVSINSNNLASLQSQINGLDASYLGSFIVQYTDRVVMYDYSKDTIKGIVQLQQPQSPTLPQDFFEKLNKHSEAQGLQNEQPVGGQLDATTLSTLQQQFPEVYANAKVGDFLLRYSTKLIIYDYNANKIVNVVNLQ